MIKTSKKELQKMVNNGNAIDISYYDEQDIRALKEKEDYMEYMAYSGGQYGNNGKLFRGEKSGNMYAIIGHTTTSYLI